MDCSQSEQQSAEGRFVLRNEKIYSFILPGALCFETVRSIYFCDFFQNVHLVLNNCVLVGLDAVLIGDDGFQRGEESVEPILTAF